MGLALVMLFAVAGVGSACGATRTRLSIAVYPQGKSAAEVHRYTLRCTPAGGTVPTPTLGLVVIEAAVKAAGHAPVLVDNTFATPVLQNPAAHGAALVLHSATK